MLRPNQKGIEGRTWDVLFMTKFIEVETTTPTANKTPNKLTIVRYNKFIFPSHKTAYTLHAP